MRRKKPTTTAKLSIKGRVIVPKGINRKQLAMGIKTELEHTSNKRIAKKIAVDHLMEDKSYYTKLMRAKL